MARSNHPAFLRLVHSDNRAGDATPAAGSATPAQDSFLPSSQPQTLIFLAWSKASSEDLLDIFELSKPKLILDMRVAPRFDLGQLNRKRFFDLLRDYDCRYVDLLGRMEVDSVHDALMNPTLIAARATEFTDKLRVAHSGPFVFIYDDDFIDDVYVSALAKALPTASGSGWEVYRPRSSPENKGSRRYQV